MGKQAPFTIGTWKKKDKVNQKSQDLQEKNLENSSERNKRGSEQRERNTML